MFSKYYNKLKMERKISCFKKEIESVIGSVEYNNINELKIKTDQNQIIIVSIIPSEILQINFKGIICYPKDNELLSILLQIKNGIFLKLNYFKYIHNPPEYKDIIPENLHDLLDYTNDS